MDLESKYNYYKWALYIIPVVIAIIYFVLKFQKDNISSQISKQKELKQERINHLNFQVALFNGTKSERIEFANSLIENDPILKGINYGEYLDKTKNQEELSFQKALSYYITDELDKAQSVLEYLLTTEINKDYDEALVNSLLGKIYLNKNELNLEKTSSHLTAAEVLFEELNNNEEIKLFQKAALFIDFGIYYKTIGNSKEAIKYYEKSLKIFNNLNTQFSEEYTGTIATIYYNLFIYYKEIGELNTGISYLKRSIEINANSKNLTKNDTSTLLKSTASIITELSLTGDWKDVDFFIGHGLSIAKQLIDIQNLDLQNSIATLYNNIGDSYNIRFENIGNEKFLLLSLEYSEKTEDIYLDRIEKGKNINSLLFASLYHGMGNTYKNLNNYKSSLKSYNKAIQVLNQYNNDLINRKGKYSTRLAHTHMALAQLYYYKIQDNKKANKAAKKASDLYMLNIKENPSLKDWLYTANEIYRLTKNN